LGSTRHCYFAKRNGSGETIGGCHICLQQQRLV